MPSQKGRAFVWFNTFPNYDKCLGASLIGDKKQTKDEHVTAVASCGVLVFPL